MAVRYREHFFKCLFNVSIFLKRRKELTLLQLTHKSRLVSLAYSEKPSVRCRGYEMEMFSAQILFEQK